tara:strand:- start:744 stop:1010 length:267 start_codon:yes stop_codon:yes gene_type:complete
MGRYIETERIYIDKTTDLMISFPPDVIDIGIDNQSKFILYVRDLNGQLISKLHDYMYTEFANPQEEFLIYTNSTSTVEIEITKIYGSN